MAMLHNQRVYIYIYSVFHKQSTKVVFTNIHYIDDYRLYDVTWSQFHMSSFITNQQGYYSPLSISNQGTLFMAHIPNPWYTYSQNPS